MLLLNRYEYNPQTDLIGKGGFARVYKALDKQENSILALKIWKTGSEWSAPYIPPDHRQKLVSLSHMHIGRYIAIEEIQKEDAFGETETTQICALEWLDGETLIQYHQSHKDPAILKKLRSGAVDGLNYLHSHGLAHGNIKASNILVTDTPEGPVVKLTDFGIFKKTGAVEQTAFDADFLDLDDVFGLLAPIAMVPNDIPAVASDDTQVLAPRPTPSASDDTQILPADSKPVPIPSDDTQLFVPPPKPVSDDTQVLSPKPAVSDDTQVLPANTKPAPVASDDTQILVPRPAASDDTQILVPKPAPLTFLFNRYEYNPNTGLIGKGGFSRVYKAFDKKLNRWVALKIYKGGEFADRYSPIAEIRRVVNLDHPNICRYLDIEEIEKENTFGERETTQICVMELLDGGNFTEYYNANRSDKTLKKLLNDVLTGLAYLHKNGIIHRDIKPANILIKETMDGPVAKITDFGISKRSDSVNNNSSSALIVSIPYMAPEQLNVKKYGVNEKISYNLDLWSLGVTIYEVVTGKVLFKNSEQDSSEQIMTNIMAPDLPEKIKELPQPFREVVSHCIVKDARHRSQKAEELIVLLHSNYDDAATVQPVAGTDTPVNANEDIAAPRTKSITKTSFFIENEGSATGKTGKLKPEKKVNPVVEHRSNNNEKQDRKMLLIGLCAGLVVVLIVLFFTMGRRENNQLADPVKKSDTTKTVSASVAKEPAPTSQTPATAPAQHQNAAPAKTDSQPAVTEASQPQPSGRHSKKTAAGEPRETQTSTSGSSNNEPASGGSNNAPTFGSSNQKYVLLLTTTQSCTVKINDIDYGTLDAGKPLRVFLLPGSYVLQATGLSNGSTYTGKLEVSEKNRSQIGRYQIPLH